MRSADRERRRRRVTVVGDPDRARPLCTGTKEYPVTGTRYGGVASPGYGAVPPSGDDRYVTICMGGDVPCPCGIALLR
jgi:hypothetical protein